MKNIFAFILACMLLSACGSQKVPRTNMNPEVVIGVNESFFKSANSKLNISIVDCTLSDKSSSKCYKIFSKSEITDHQMGPWCPTKITDDAQAGGIWINDSKTYDVYGEFVKNMDTFYDDTNWKMHDEQGNIFVTKTQADCENAANPNVEEEYKNFSVECLPSYISEVTRPNTIPMRPVMLSTAESYARGPRGGGRAGGSPPGGRPPRGDRPDGGLRGAGGPPPNDGGMPFTRGVALNGVEFSAPATTSNILSAYTLAPFDDAGGHINVHQGYHYHLATGVSFSIAQNDDHAPLIGYAMDGHGIYGSTDKSGNEANDLDDCRGHYDDIRGYHYRVDDAGNNNFINCLHGAYAL